MVGGKIKMGGKQTDGVAGRHVWLRHKEDIAGVNFAFACDIRMGTGNAQRRERPGFIWSGRTK